MSPSSAQLFKQFIDSVMISWSSMLLWCVIIAFLLYIRINQVRVRKIRKSLREQHTRQVGDITSDVINQYIKELDEQNLVLGDLIQNTNEQLDTLKLNGGIDHEVLQMIYHATSSNEQREGQGIE